ncbi:hypothetical protein CWM58_21450 [Klebsiella sp. H-Nf2]|uniref:hypothetical protein n=1 Tax=Klebsiella sp. H-Nf2 TaxID=2054599 RepID=UPI000C28AF75|nr:hypothetical protein [Klebsiella sp. H-Nf2]PJR48908.1 hypothetical protein CWM58_21450 [Klebsiella sp. H-Nf2]
MKQLTVFEMEAISGGYTWDFSSASAAITSLASNAVEAVGAMALGGIVTAVIGAWFGGTQSGTNGGIFGFGLIANGVGAIAGFILGAIGGTVGSLALGWDGTLGYMKEFLDKTLDGTFTPVH